MRSTVQPFRRNSALYRVYDDLILYLKSELNWQDLSFYYQEVIEPSGLNENILPNDYLVPLPSFDKEHKTHSIFSFHKTNVASAYFSGQHESDNGDMIYGQSIPVSGTGVYTTGPELDSASEFDLKGDFCIEFWSQFSGVPDSASGSYLFDFGNLKLSNTSGFFSIEAPDSPQKYFDWYDPDFRSNADPTLPTMTNRFTHYAVQKKNDKIQLWVGPMENDNATPGPFFKVLEEPFFDERQQYPNNNYLITGHSEEPYNNIRTFGTTISGTHPYTGWMDEIKVWKKWIYEGPVVLGGPSVSGIYVSPPYADNSLQSRIALLENPQIYVYKHQVAETADVLLFCQVKTYYDPRYSLNLPMPYEIRWYKDKVHASNLIATSEDGNTTTVEQEDKKYVMGEDGLCTLKIKNFDHADQGVYWAVVLFGPTTRPINVIPAKPVLLEIIPKPPPPPPYITTINCGTKHNIGSDVTVCANLNNLTSNNYVGPISWKWHISGWVKQTADTDTKSCITFLNLKRNTGPFKIEAIDAEGKTWSAWCAGVGVIYPPLQCPSIIDLLPNQDKANEYSVSPKGILSQVQSANVKCSWRRDISIKPDQTSIDLDLEIIATDPNIPELLTGGLRYEWWEPSANQWVNGLSSKTVTVSDNTKTWVKARVGYNNYPGLDPNGNRQEKWATCYWYINYPECKEPSVEWVGKYTGYINTTNRGGGLPNNTNSGSGSWSTVNSDLDEVTVNVFACSEDTKIALYGFFNRNNSSFNNLQYGNPNCARYSATASRWLLGGSYTYDVGALAPQANVISGPGIKTSQGGPNASQNPATFTVEEYTQPHDCWGPKADKLIITKDMYNQDDGSWVKIDFHNECGTVSKKVNFKVVKEAPCIIQAVYPFRWYWGSKQRLTRLPFYRYFHVFAYSLSTLRQGVTKKYSDYWSPSRSDLAFLIKPTLSGCMFWQLKLNGQVLSGWNHMPGGSLCGINSLPCGSYYNNNGITLAFSTAFGQRSAALSIDAKKAWDSIPSNIFQKGVNNLELKICNNPPDKNINNIPNGTCASHNVEIILEDAPIIISPINNKLSGVFNKPTQTWWWRWWWPWYNPFFNPNGNPPEIYGLLKGNNGWWRWNYANTRPAGANSKNASRISLRNYVAMR
tara:strand:+ start:39279 stop:42683 length:3405 start_codon:yes stop_codon:yes gene_type:complete